MQEKLIFLYFFLLGERLLGEKDKELNGGSTLILITAFGVISLGMDYIAWHFSLRKAASSAESSGAISAYTHAW